MHSYQAARLKLDDAELTRVLDELDARARAAGDLRTPERYGYRVRDVRVDVFSSRDVCTTYVVPTRNIGSDSLCFLSPNLIHPHCMLELHLTTARGGRQTIRGQVLRCVYVEGASGVHEVDARFARPIDPVSFAPSAIRTRVLLADDSAMARRLMGHLLDGLNAEVSSVSSAIEAIEQAEQGNFDLVLMDIEMPELDGLSAVRMLRSKGYLRSIVAISSLEEPNLDPRCKAAGCDGFLPKAEVRTRLPELLARNKPEPLVSSLLHDSEMHPLIDEFVADVADRVRALEAALSDGDLERLAVEVRKVKGEAHGFGFEPLSEAAGELESLLQRQAGKPEIHAKLVGLVRLCLAARPATIRERRYRDDAQAIVDELLAGTDEPDA